MDLPAHWTKVSDTRYVRADGARVEKKPFGDLWGWVSPDGVVERGVRGKKTAAEAILHVETEWSLDGGASDYTLGPRDAPTTSRLGRYWAELEHERQADDPLAEMSPESFARALESRRSPSPPSAPLSSVDPVELERRLGEMRPSAFARALGRATSPRTPGSVPRAPTHVEALVQDQLARQPSRAPSPFTPLPAPVALPPATRARPASTSAPLTERSPAPERARESQALTRPWSPPRALVNEAMPETTRWVRQGAPVAQARANDYRDTLNACSKRIVREALEANGQNKSAAARALGLTRQSLYKILDREQWDAGAKTA